MSSSLWGLCAPCVAFVCLSSCGVLQLSVCDCVTFSDNYYVCQGPSLVPWPTPARLLAGWLALPWWPVLGHVPGVGHGCGCAWCPAAGSVPSSCPLCLRVSLVTRATSSSCPWPGEGHGLAWPFSAAWDGRLCVFVRLSFRPLVENKGGCHVSLWSFTVFSQF